MGDLATAFKGGFLIVVLAIVESLADLIYTTFDALVISPLNFYQTQLTETIQLTLNSASLWGLVSWWQLETVVEDFGLFAYLVAIAGAMAVAWTIALVIDWGGAK